jgi:hypothetical protein
MLHGGALGRRWIDAGGRATVLQLQRSMRGKSFHAVG